MFYNILTSTWSNSLVVLSSSNDVNSTLYEQDCQHPPPSVTVSVTCVTLGCLLVLRSLPQISEEKNDCLQPSGALEPF